ncbi:MAG TPA: PIN domain-containing protein [Chlamydiales bacterium]|nr:PIN domain-containing protein [Chlamydiales bacterium]
MNSLYLLDTCVVSDYFKKNPKTIHHFQSVAPYQLHISMVTVMEVEFGLKLNPEREKKLRPLWEALLLLIIVIPFDRADASAAALIRAKMKPAGNMIGPYDLLLAGTAFQRKFIFVTSNSKEFKRLPELQLQDWRL